MPLTLTPAVFVGIGGSGHTVLSKIRRRLLEQTSSRRRQGHRPTEGDQMAPGFQFLVLDLDRNRPADLSPHDPSFDNDVEFPRLQAPSVDSIQGGIKRRLKRYEHLRPWWPAGLDEVLRRRFARRNLEQAYQTRPFGRAAVFLNAGTIEEHVSRAIRAAASNEVPQQAEVVFSDVRIDGPVTVNIVASIAGGTGCGMFLDVAALVQSVLQNANIVARGMNLFLLLPDLFADLPMQEGTNPNIPKANAYGALKELDPFLCDARRFDVRYDEVRAVRLDTLANYVYLVAGSNEPGHAVGRRADIAEHLAGFALMLSGGLDGQLDLGAGRRLRFAGLHTLPANVHASKAYSSFGYRAVRYPMNWVQDYCRATLTEALAEELRSQRDAKQEVSAIVDGHPETGRVAFWSLESPLLPSLHESPPGFLQQTTGHFRQIARRQLAARVKGEYERARDQIEASRARMLQAAKLATEASRQAPAGLLREQLTRLLENRDLGLSGARAFLELLEAAIKVTRQSALTRQAEAGRVCLNDRVLAARHQAFDAGCKSLFTWRETVLKPYLMDLQADVRGRVQAARAEADATACQALLNLVVEPARRQVESLAASLADLSRSARERVSELRSQIDAMARRENLIGCGLEKRMAIEETCADKALEKQQAARSAIARRLALDPAELSSFVEMWAAEVPLFAESLREQLPQGQDLATWLTENVRAAAPFWSYDVAQHGPAGGLLTYVLSRVDGKWWKGRLPNAELPFALVEFEVLEPNEVAFVTVRDGAPVEHLRAMQECFKRYYEEDKGRPANDRWPCTVLPGSEGWNELLPLDLVEFDYERIISTAEKLALMSRNKSGSLSLRLSQGRPRRFASRAKLAGALRTDATLLEALKTTVTRHFLELGRTHADTWLHQNQEVLPAELERSIRTSLGL